jgi:phage terminase large subunit
MATMLAGSVAGAAAPRRIVLQTHAQRRILCSTADELAVSGGWFTGKSFPLCLLAYSFADNNPGARVALLREERASMRDSIEKTIRDEVLPPAMLAWHTDNGGWGWKASDDTFYLPRRNGRQSIIVLAGLDKPQRFMGPNFSLVCVSQAEQLSFDQFQIASSRAGRQAEIPNGRLVMEFNPEGSGHWAAKRYRFDLGSHVRTDERGLVLETVVCGQSDAFLFASPKYRAKLESLEGSWRDRYLLGKWTSFEGGVYAGYDPERHLIKRPADWLKWDGYPPPDWPRSRAFDFGVNDPCVCLWFAREPGGREIVYRQLYRCDLTDVELGAMVLEYEAQELAALRAHCEGDDAQNYASWLASFQCESSWSDHDLNWRNNLKRLGVWTQPAAKDINTGILSVTEALRQNRLAIVRDCWTERDPRRLRDEEATCLEDEFSGYRWVNNHPKGQDHALDALRYKINSDRTRPSGEVAG